MRSLATRFHLTGPGARRRRLALAAAVVALAVIPASLVGASTTFTDVPSSGTLHDAVTALVNAGITAGCSNSPPKYCPNNAVTRGQMAIFMDRLGGLSGSKPPVVDALSVNGEVIQGGGEDFDLTGGSSSECKQTLAAIPPEVNPFGSYTITYQLYATPNGIAPEDINIQLQDSDADADVNDNVFNVCFATIDGALLPAGTYNTYFNFIVFINQGRFGSASTAQSTASSHPARASK